MSVAVEAKGLSSTRVVELSNGACRRKQNAPERWDGRWESGLEPQSGGFGNTSESRALSTSGSGKCEAEMKVPRVNSGARLLGSRSVLLGHRVELRNFAA